MVEATAAGFNHGNESHVFVDEVGEAVDPESYSDRFEVLVRRAPDVRKCEKTGEERISGLVEDRSTRPLTCCFREWTGCGRTEPDPHGSGTDRDGFTGTSAEGLT
ncbi:hypothetical protein AB0J14_10025 [Micromonospora arborensis]|uniref:hypothetical protein n=1 Tax=Micromonospora arborensis TaxID=2116518 RepID=UPI0033F5C42F